MFPKSKERKDGYFSWCKVCKSEKAKADYAAAPEKAKARAAKRREENPDAMRIWREQNKENIRAYNKKHYDENREYHLERDKAYRLANPDRDREYRAANIERFRELGRIRRATPRGKLNGFMSSGMKRALKSGKNGLSWQDMVDYTVDELKVHLESLFLPGMTWENHGQFGWHIDHKIPLAAFNFDAPDQIDFKRAWDISNLQPLWWRDNLTKRDKLDGPFQPSLAI